MIQVQVRDKSPKRIIRQLLLTGKGERDAEGKNAVLQDWITGTTDQPTFSRYCRRQSWTLAQVLALLDYQCSYIFACGIDESEFNALWPTFQPIIRDQRLLDVRKMVRVIDAPIPAPGAATRAMALEV